MPDLIAQPLTAEAFAPFGKALLVPENQSGKPINNGSSQRFDGLALLDFLREGGLACLSVFRSQGAVADGAGYQLQLLERHVLGSQIFVPLGPARLLVVVAKSRQEAGAPPEEQSIQAFMVEPGQGVSLRAGVWHHPLMTIGPADVLVLERQAEKVDCELAVLQSPWVLKIPN